MKKKFYSILAMMGMIMSRNGDYRSKYARKGQWDVDTSDPERKKRRSRHLANSEKPWKGMKFYPDHGVYAINEKNAIRKSKRLNTCTSSS